VVYISTFLHFRQKLAANFVAVLFLFTNLLHTGNSSVKHFTCVWFSGFGDIYMCVYILCFFKLLVAVNRWTLQFTQCCNILTSKNSFRFSNLIVFFIIFWEISIKVAQNFTPRPIISQRRGKLDLQYWKLDILF